MRRYTLRMSSAKRLVVVLFALVLGCATTPKMPEPPVVYVTGISPTGGGLLEQKIRVGLRIENPNNFELQMTGIEFDLDLNGRPFARGMGSHELTLPRLGSQELSVQATTTVIEVLRRSKACRTSTTWDTRFAGACTWTTLPWTAFPSRDRPGSATPRGELSHSGGVLRTSMISHVTSPFGRRTVISSPSRRDRSDVPTGESMLIHFFDASISSGPTMR